MRTIYLAGPDVFLPDAKQQGKRLKELCFKYGFKGLFPLDNELNASKPELLAQKIQKANIQMIHDCDLVIANLSPFRGPEPDSGTVFEVGYALGLGKDVYGYSNDMRTLKQKTIDLCNLPKDATCDKNGLYIEDFNLTHNLMFSHLVLEDSFEKLLQKITSTPI